MNSLILKPIGYVRSEHQKAEDTPIQSIFCSGCKGRVELLPQYSEGLTDIEEFSHIILLYWLHKSEPGGMLVKPFLEDKFHGIFATRAPVRPNPLGFSIVRLNSREDCILNISCVDILDNTPVLDIKPYSSKFDSFPGSRNGWYEGIDAKTTQQLGLRNYYRRF